MLKEKLIIFLKVTLPIIHTKRRAGILIATTSILTVGFMILMIGMIQDYLRNEFNNFNKIGFTLISLGFNNDWKETMRIFSFLGSKQVQLNLIGITFIWIIWKGMNKLIEVGSFLIVIFGGELLEESLRRIFQSLFPASYSFTDHLFYHFPSEQSLMDFIIYGFAVFIFLRLINNAWAHTIVPITGLVLLFLIAISRLFFKVELPSDIAAGYVFGGVWLGLNILLLEIFRLLRRINIY